ncbi:helix-turn-helix transcriptional regulator [Candidatus Roizmanbacteria bacterium]|nr:helix-turn-helix transcriptional regulator [Candidatus Roizmanbacteria bacterium]
MEPNFSKMIGDRIKEIRESKKLSLESVAEKAHLSVAAFKNLEEGKRKRITVSLSYDVARALDVPVKELLGNIN